MVNDFIQFFRELSQPAFVWSLALLGAGLSSWTWIASFLKINLSKSISIFLIKMGYLSTALSITLFIVAGFLAEKP